MYDNIRRIISNFINNKFYVKYVRNIIVARFIKSAFIIGIFLFIFLFMLLALLFLSGQFSFFFVDAYYCCFWMSSNRFYCRLFPFDASTFLNKRIFKRIFFFFVFSVFVSGKWTEQENEIEYASSQWILSMIRTQNKIEKKMMKFYAFYDAEFEI